jgi:hypothetical protein
MAADSPEDPCGPIHYPYLTLSYDIIQIDLYETKYPGASNFVLRLMLVWLASGPSFLHSPFIT